MSLIKYIKTILTVFVLFLLPAASLVAQTTQQKGVNMDEYSKLAGAVLFLLVAFLFIMFLVLSMPKYHYSREKKLKEASAFKKFRQKITQAVPVEEEHDIMLEHEYDGIKELDNKVPPWFNVLFAGTVIFAVVYLLVYHVTGSGKLMADEYIEEMQIAQQHQEELIRTGALINENTVTLLTDAQSLDNGKTVFMNNCVPCHGPNAGGVVGPNLTDDYWIHGGGIKNIFKTIKYGVPAKGMITWQTQLNPKKMQEVASYIISLHGTNPAGGKPPEGQVWVDSTDTQTKIPGDTSKTVTKKSDSLKVAPKVDSTKKGK